MTDNKPKNYYHDIFLDMLEDVKKLPKKPTLLLHACCGPCLTYPLSILYEYFDITIFYSNPNIYPKEEYKKRYDTLYRFVHQYAIDKHFNITVVKVKDNFEEYQTLFHPFKDEKEGGSRCEKCHTYRLTKAIEYATKNKFDYVTTTMTVSSKKPSSLINEIGISLVDKYDISNNSKTIYLVSDFKKDDGTLKGIKIAKEYKMYRQDYCGCNFSLEERNNRVNKTEQIEETCE